MNTIYTVYKCEYDPLPHSHVSQGKGKGVYCIITRKIIKKPMKNLEFAVARRKKMYA